MRYGIYGGAFDPIHLGHLLLAETCLCQAKLDRVIFIPTGVSPHRAGKNSYQASAEDRFRMVGLALQGSDEFEVSRFEIDRPGPSFTVETLRHFAQTLETGSKLFLIMGADMFHDLPNWREPETICRLATLLIACRSGSAPPRLDDPELKMSTQSVQMPQIDLSSTQIRTAVAAGKSIRFQVPPSVAAYIASHGLYSESAMR